MANHYLVPLFLRIRALELQWLHDTLAAAEYLRSKGVSVKAARFLAEPVNANNAGKGAWIHTPTLPMLADRRENYRNQTRDADTVILQCATMQVR